MRFLCALALVLLAFAHKPIDLEGHSGYDLAAYTLPDGTIPVLCQPSGDKDDGHGLDGHFYGQDCEACRISSAFGCPAPSKASGPALGRAEAVALALAAPVIKRNTYPPSAPPQAPPSFV